MHEESAHGDGGALGHRHHPDLGGAGEGVGEGERGLADAHGPVSTLLNYPVAQVGVDVGSCVEGDVREVFSRHLRHVEQVAGHLVVAEDVADHALFPRASGLSHEHLLVDEAIQEDTRPVEGRGRGGALHLDAPFGERDVVLLVVKRGEADAGEGERDAREGEKRDEDAKTHACSGCE